MAPTSTWILALAACAGSEPDGASGSPSLWVQGALAFDGVEIGSDEPRVETLWVENVGTGLLFVDEQRGDMHDESATTEVPLTRVPYSKLCPGSAALDKLQKAYR